MAYEGGRTASEIISWLKKRVSPSTKKIDSVSDFDALIANNDVVVTFWGDNTHPSYSAFDLASK